MKSVLLSFWLILLSPFSYADEVELDLEANSLTYFENPFLIGDWYFLNRLISRMTTMYFISH